MKHVQEKADTWTKIKRNDSRCFIKSGSLYIERKGYIKLATLKNTNKPDLIKNELGLSKNGHRIALKFFYSDQVYKFLSY